MPGRSTRPGSLFIHSYQINQKKVVSLMCKPTSDDCQPLAVHGRLHGIGKFSTFDAHYPEHKLSVARFEVRHGQEQAKKLGPNVEKLVDELFANDHPLRHLRRVQGILRLAKKHPITPQALDHSCQRAMAFNKPRLSYIKDCALYFATHGQRPTLTAPHRKIDTVHLHGSHQLAGQIEAEEDLL